MDSLPVNVIILPDEKTQHKARELGKILADNFEGYYTLADRRFIPHVTIYQAQYPVENLEKIKDLINNLNKNFIPFEVSVDSYQSSHGYIWWNILENENLTRLHYQVMNELNPFRKGLLIFHLTSTGYKTGEKFTEEEAENVRKYGAVVVGKLFQPHITLAKLKEDVRIQQLHEILGEAKSQFMVSRIFIGEMGDYGTVIKIL